MTSSGVPPGGAFRNAASGSSPVEMMRSVELRIVTLGRNVGVEREAAVVRGGYEDVQTVLLRLEDTEAGRDVGADLAGLTDTQQRIEVGAVHVHLPAVIVNDPADIDDGFLENPMGGWIGDHQRGQIVAIASRLVLKIRHVHVAGFVAGHYHHF